MLAKKTLRRESTVIKRLDVAEIVLGISKTLRGPFSMLEVLKRSKLCELLDLFEFTINATVYFPPGSLRAIAVMQQLSEESFWPTSHVSPFQECEELSWRNT